MDYVELNKIFTQFCKKVNGWGALNYCASLKVFPALEKAGSSAKEIVESALKKSVKLSHCYKYTEQEILEDVEKSLLYVGDDGAYPNLDFVKSENFKIITTKILESIKTELSKSSQVIGVSIVEGHPFYPVFWDFSFILESNENAYLVVGSSSD